MIGTFENVLNYLQKRNHSASLVEASTGNRYRVRSILNSLKKQPDEPGYNPNLRFAEVQYVDAVYQGTQGFIEWIVPNANPGQRKILYAVTTVQNWFTAGDYWNPDWVNGLRQ